MSYYWYEDSLVIQGSEIFHAENAHLSVILLFSRFQGMPTCKEINMLQINHCIFHDVVKDQGNAKKNIYA